MIIMQNRFRHWVGILAAIFLGVTLLVAGSSKLLTPVVENEIPEFLLVLLIIIELTIGLLLVAGIFVKEATVFSLPLIAGFITSNLLGKVLGEEECLSCFGGMGKFSSTQALYIDGIMVALVVTILAFYPSRFSSVRPWYWGKSTERR